MSVHPFQIILHPTNSASKIEIRRKIGENTTSIVIEGKQISKPLTLTIRDEASLIESKAKKIRPNETVLKEMKIDQTDAHQPASSSQPTCSKSSAPTTSKSLLEQPPVLQSKRIRITPRPFDPSNFGSFAVHRISNIIDLSVSKLGKIERINENIKHASRVKLGPLYKLCMGYYYPNTKDKTVRNSLREFRGFMFPRDSFIHMRKRAFLNDLETKEIKGICEVLGIEFSESKKVTIEKIIDFLMEPNLTNMCLESEGKSQQSTENGIQVVANEIKEETIEFIEDVQNTTLSVSSP